jgi:hypothetical protein
MLGQVAQCDHAHLICARPDAIAGLAPFAMENAVTVLQKSESISRGLTKQNERRTVLDFEDIRHFLMSRPPARAARYEFLTFRSAAGGRAWLMGLIDKVGTAQAVGANVADSRWVTIGFTWSGFQALSVDEASLGTFPEEFRQGMAARADILGLTGANHPSHWVGGWQVRSFMRLPYCSPATSPNARTAEWSMSAM